MADTDARQQKVYGQDRYDIAPKEQRPIHFSGWVKGACYQPMLVAARTQRGQTDLERWLGNRGAARPITELTATGDIEIVFKGEPVCVPKDN